MTETDNIVVAAQEHAAKKHAGVFPGVQKMNRCFIGRHGFMPL
jgi:hypothetical protein